MRHLLFNHPEFNLSNFKSFMAQRTKVNENFEEVQKILGTWHLKEIKR